MGYVVKTQEFEGPLDLLLTLIEKRKLLINDLSLSKVTGDYIDYIQSLEGDHAREISDFLVVAATLMLIKSKSLLPDMDLSYEEEAQIEDLEERLSEYRRLRSLASHVSDLFARSPMFARTGRFDDREPRFTPSDDLRIGLVHTAAVRLVRSLPKEQKRPSARVEKTISLKEVIETLSQRIKSGLSTTFSDVVEDERKERVYVIVHFLALLELIKQDVAAATQREDGSIIVESKDVSTPHY